MLFRPAQIVLGAADFALTQTHYAAAFTKTLDVYFRATHDSCSTSSPYLYPELRRRPPRQRPISRSNAASYECPLRPGHELSVAMPCRVRVRLSACKPQIEPETQKIACWYRVDIPVLSLIFPRINHVNAAVLKVLRVARSEACSSRTSHGDNHGIELADGFACSSSRGGDIRVHICCFAVETQYLF